MYLNRDMFLEHNSVQFIFSVHYYVMLCNTFDEVTEFLTSNGRTFHQILKWIANQIIGKYELCGVDSGMLPKLWIQSFLDKNKNLDR
jgi:hypothetical protein